jgi:RNA polymerase sigma-70 factor, ECF subfamily
MLTAGESQGTTRATGEAERESRLIRRAIAAAKDGDRDAMSFLYVRYADNVHGYVRSIVRDHHTAEDITQQVFAKLMGSIVKYQERDVPFLAWILRVARNVAVDHMRQQRMLPVEEVRGVHEADEGLATGRASELREALAGLPEDQREVLVLRHVAGLSPGQIAERLGKTEGSIHGLHHRGRAALKDALVQLNAAPSTAARARRAPQAEGAVA